LLGGICGRVEVVLMAIGANAPIASEARPPKNARADPRIRLPAAGRCAENWGRQRSMEKGVRGSQAAGINRAARFLARLRKSKLGSGSSPAVCHFKGNTVQPLGRRASGIPSSSNPQSSLPGIKCRSPRHHGQRFLGTGATGHRGGLRFCWAADRRQSGTANGRDLDRPAWIAKGPEARR